MSVQSSEDLNLEPATVNFERPECLNGAVERIKPFDWAQDRPFERAAVFFALAQNPPNPLDCEKFLAEKKSLNFQMRKTVAACEAE